MSEGSLQPPVRRPTALLKRLRRLLVPILVTSTIYFGMLVYPPLRLAHLLWPDWQPGTATLLPLMVLPIAGRVVYELRPGTLARAVAALSMTWLGACFVLLCVLLPLELVNLWLGLAPDTLGLFVATATAGLLGLALINAQRLRITELQIRGTGLTAGAGPDSGTRTPLTLAHISDVHVGSRSAAFLRRVVRATQRLQPDLVVITGDLVDFANISTAALGALAELQVPVYYCIGNHERYVDLEDICARLASHGVIVLRDRWIQHGELVIVGIDDAERRDRVEQGLAQMGPLPEGYRILLYHRPDGLEAAHAAGIDLMLAGHTHNGQLIPFNFIVRRVFPRIRGLYRHGRTRLWVSSGTGTWGPVLRLGSVNEITRIELS